MTITSDTKIAALLKHNPDALEAIISISDNFVKLRNPLLRKLMAGRTSIAQACRIGGCTIDDFFARLEPLGFIPDRKALINESPRISQVPGFIMDLKPGKVIEMDVRPVIAGGKDPLNAIVEKIKVLDTGMVLKLVNSFEPTPLISLLKRQGFNSAVEYAGTERVITYFFREEESAGAIAEVEVKHGAWEEIWKRFERKIETVNVRAMEMPLPMLTILDALDHLPADTALHVYHKRIPVFLLPELAERKFGYRIKEVGENEVELLIFRG